MAGMRGDRYLFLMLCVTIWLAIANGAIFCFPLLSPALTRDGVGFSTRDVTTVSTTGAVMSYLSLPTGLLYDRFGPRPTLLVGGLVCVVGWATLALQFGGTLPLSVASVSVSYGVSQLSATFFETGTVLTNLDAFSLHQGRVIMIQKTYMGFGSSIIAMVYAAFFAEARIEFFILFLCGFGGSMALLGAWLVRLPLRHPELQIPGLNRGDPSGRYDRSFMAGVCLMATMLVFIFAVDVVSAELAVPRPARVALGSATILLSLLFGVMPLLVPGPHGDPHGGPPLEHGSSLAVTAAGTTDDPTFGVLPKTTGTNVHGLRRNVRRPELWLLWYVCFCTWGAMTLVNSNTTFIYQAVAGEVDKVRNSVYVSVFGIAGALGRIAVGALQPVMDQRGVPVWHLLPAAPLLMALGLLLFLVVGEHGLIVPFLVVGLATGLVWGAVVLVMKRLFVQTGRHYAFLYTAGALTPLFFSLFLFSTFFEQESRRQGQPSLSDCDGLSCIFWPVVVTAALNATAVGAALLFARRLSAGALGADDTIDDAALADEVGATVPVPVVLAPHPSGLEAAVELEAKMLDGHCDV